MKINKKKNNTHTLEEEATKRETKNSKIVVY